VREAVAEKKWVGGGAGENQKGKAAGWGAEGEGTGSGGKWENKLEGTEIQNLTRRNLMVKDGGRNRGGKVWRARRVRMGEPVSNQKNR